MATDLLQFLKSEGPAAINPDVLYPEELADVTKMDCLREFWDEFRRGAQVRKHLALLRQRQIGLASRRLQHFASRSGSRIVARVDPLLFHEIRTNYGPTAWTDPKLRADTLKRHPEMAVPNAQRHTTVSLSGRGHGAAGDPPTARRIQAHATPPAGIPLVQTPGNPSPHSTLNSPLSTALHA